MVNTALEFSIVNFFKKGALVIHAAIAALHTFAMDVVGHLADLAQNILEKMNRWSFAQCSKMDQHCPDGFFVFKGKTQFCKDQGSQQREHRKQQVHRENAKVCGDHSE